MNGREHLEAAQKWLKEAEGKYLHYGSTDVNNSRIIAAATIARTHAILAVQLLNGDGNDE